jgi:threonyl-tRNA synthetase
VVVTTIVSDVDDYARDVARRLKEAGLVVETDLRNEKINYKVREHSSAKVPVILVVGAREAEEGTVNVRRLGSRDQRTVAVDRIIAELAEEATPPDIRREHARRARAGRPPENRIDVVEVFEGFVVNDAAEGLSSSVFDSREEAVETARRILMERGGGVVSVSTLAGETDRLVVEAVEAAE